MAYKIKQRAELGGVGVRTVGYYDQIGLLKPAWVGKNGYRYYDTPQVDRLQQICLYRAMAMPLAMIQALLDRPATQRLAGLEQQYQRLQAERDHLDQLLSLVQTTIQTQREEPNMTDEAKFQTFKNAQLTTNEQQYGPELREKYDAATLKDANAQFANLTASEYQRMQAVERDLLAQLTVALGQNALSTSTATSIYQLHRQWLSFTWPQYTAAMHRGLAAMYLADERFQNYYDQRVGAGATALLAQIITDYAHD